VTWAVAYLAALWVTVLLCWGRGPGYRKASLILGANWLVQVGCQLAWGAQVPAVAWLVRDLAAALVIAWCPYAERAHAIVATVLGFQVLTHLAFIAAGYPMGEVAFYFALTGLGGWGQLATLVGGAYYGPMRRLWMAWFVGGRFAPAVGGRGQGMETRQ
jgi:hypothetical protein